VPNAYVASPRSRNFNKHTANGSRKRIAARLGGEAIAVGSLALVDEVTSQLGVKAMHHEVVEVGGTYTRREQTEAYAGDFGSEGDALMPDNTIPWEKNAKSTGI